ncbi:MAG: flippase-like domain-containing protein, partial [Oscillospiraceae bacterium]|nr:flippase-like domain-containing protein [Oscillospiraceae bacterium]
MNILFAAAVLILAVGHSFRMLRWSELIKVYERTDKYVLLRSISVGYGVDFFLPFHIGDIVRGVYLGKKLKNKYTFSFATILIDRLLDVFMVAAIYIVILVTSGEYPGMAAVYSLFALALTAMIIISVRSARIPKLIVLKIGSVFNDKIQLSILKCVWSGICILKELIRAANKWLVVTYSFIMWGCYLGSYYLFAAALCGINNASTVSVFNGIFGSDSGSTFFKMLFSKGEFPIETAIYFAVTLMVIFILSLLLRPIREKNGGHSGSGAVMPFTNDSEQLSFLREYFSELKSNRYFHEFAAANNDVQIMKNCSAGSNAVTLLCRGDSAVFFRKYAFGADAVKLGEQVGWLERHSGSLPLTAVYNIRKDETMCSYDMPFNAMSSNFFEFIHSMPLERSWDILNRAIAALEENYRKSAYAAADKKTIDEYIEQKARKNIEKIKNASMLKALYKPEVLIVNGVEYKNLRCFEKYLSDNSFWEKIFERDSYADIHGDLTIENIICCEDYPDGYYLIDPNGGNIHNSPDLDYAKLLQSLHGGYEFLMHTASVKTDADSVSYGVISSSAYERLYGMLRDYMDKNFPRERVRSIYFHEIIHWLRLMPYK